MSTLAPAWKRLFPIACSLIDQVNSSQTVIDAWTLGGGTAMMIQIDHRDSHDIDVFLPDPQLLSLLDPKTRDFRFETPPSDYQGDGARYLKISFSGLGEIDFIVSGAITTSSSIQRIVEGRKVDLETIPEIIAKKIFYRGGSIRARDIFDVAAAADQHADAIVAALKPHKDRVTNALSVIDRLNPDFVRNAIANLAVKPAFQTVAERALPRAVEVLKAV